MPSHRRVKVLPDAYAIESDSGWQQVLAGQYTQLLNLTQSGRSQSAEKIV